MAGGLIGQFTIIFIFLFIILMYALCINCLLFWQSIYPGLNPSD